MANTVQIVVSVDNASAVQALGTTTAALKTLGSTASTVQGQWSGFSTGAIDSTRGMIQFAQATEKVDTALKTTSGHLTTSLDGVRLLSQEFGLKLPRALESILSRMPAVTSAIQGALTGLAGFAVAEVLFRAGDAVYNLYNKYISLTAAAEDYNKTVQKRKDEDFIESHSIETATDRIKGATAAAKEFFALRDKYSNAATSGNEWNPVLAVGQLLDARKAADMGYKAQSQADALKQKQLSQQHELNIMQIDAAHAADGELRGQQKINAEMEKRLAINRENQNYTRAQDASLQGGGDARSGAQKRALEDAQARAEAGAQRVELERQITQKTASLQAEATNAALVGNQLLTAQKLEAEAEIRRSGTGTAQQIDAIELKYHNEQMKRLKEEQEAVDKRAHTEAEAGLTTFDKLRAQGQDRIQEISDKQAKGLYADQSKPGDASALADKDRATAQAELVRTMTEAQKNFDAEQQASLDRSTNEQLGAFARIEADLQRSLQRRVDEYTKFYGDLQQQDAVHMAAAAQLAAQNDEDTVAAARQRAQLEQQIHEQTLQKDREAAQAEARGRSEGLGGWVDKYRASVNQIEAEHTAMIAKIDAEAAKPGVTASALADYQRQKVDADAIANAQIEDANQQLAHSIAGTLEGAFDSPIKTIQKKFEKMFFDIAAQWLAHSGIFGQVPGTASGGTASGTSAAAGGGGIAGTIARSVGLGGFGGGAGTGSAAGGFSGSAVGSVMHSLGFGHPAAAVNAPTPSQQSSITTPPINSPAASTAPAGSAAAFPPSSTSSLATGGSGISNAGSSAPGATPISGTGAASSVGTLSTTLGTAGSALGANAAATAGLSTAGSFIGAGVGAYTGARGLVGSFESGNAGGILSGAASGAELGGSVGMLFGPEGAAIGAAAGALGGLAVGALGDVTGEGGRLGGAKYFKDSMRPQMEAAEQAYARGTGTASSTLSTINGIVQSGMTTIFQKYGTDASVWVRDHYITTEQKFLEGEINRMGGAGKDYGATSAVQFHSGGTIRDFGDLATSGSEGFIHAMLGEKVTNPAASSTHGRYIDAMNSGASESDIAAMYLRNSSAAGAGGDTHIHQYGDVHVSALDSSDFEDYLGSRGGMDVIAKMSNARSGAYGGDSF